MPAMELHIEKLVYGGEGLGRLEGRAVLLPLVLPGERVAAQTVKEEPRLVRARLGQVLEPSPARIAPQCVYFTRCGGCHYQHIGYEDQLRYKAGILAETLQRVGKIAAPEPELLGSPPWQYRNRAQFKTHKQDDTFQLGYFELGSHRLLPVEGCPISSPRINEIVPELWRLGRRPDFPAGSGEIEVFMTHDDSGALVNVASQSRWPETLVSALREHIADVVSLSVVEGHARLAALPRSARRRVFGPGYLLYRAGNMEHRVSHGSFFQTNRFLADTLAGVATENLEGDTALDLFAGVGYFALHLAGKFRRVVAVESSDASIRDLESNRQRSGMAHVEAVRATAEEFLAQPNALPRRGSARGPLHPDAVLLDPPRAGLSKAAAERLAGLEAPTIVYVSCDPSTLARDLARLTARGYRLSRLRLVDLFPQTFHIETIATLERDTGKI